MKNMTPVQVAEWLGSVAAGAQLSADSRSIQVGDVFFAFPNDSGDGRCFIPHAIERGARAVLHEKENFTWQDEWNIPHLSVEGLKKKAGEIANAWYGQQDAGMFTVAVTGTNGKTSCAQWLGSALSRLLNAPSVVIGTLGVSNYVRGEHGEFHPTGYTTPDAVLLQRSLAQAKKAGAQALAIEASSIGLDQGRLNGMHIDAAVFTNFTRDHLDYHGDMAAYEEAKSLLFDWPGLKHAVINLDDEMGLRLVKQVQDKNPVISIIGYTLSGKSVDGVQILQAIDVRLSHAGTAFNLRSPFGSAHIKIQLVGLFNVSNVLGIMGVLLGKGWSLKATIDAVELLTAVPGRMQQFGGNDAPLVVIDYAHTPDALEKTLATLRQMARERSGKLWCVFGCGGDRDPGKRPQMGAVSAMADHVIVTSDNPRSENPETIIAQIIEGIERSQKSTLKPLAIEDRAAAILWAVKHANKRDVILLAGKGHETTQEIKNKKLSFLDADHAALALAARATMKGAHV